jgi:hypothetical protein
VWAGGILLQEARQVYSNGGVRRSKSGRIVSGEMEVLLPACLPSAAATVMLALPVARWVNLVRRYRAGRRLPGVECQAPPGLYQVLFLKQRYVRVDEQASRGLYWRQ